MGLHGLQSFNLSVSIPHLVRSLGSRHCWCLPCNLRVCLEQAEEKIVIHDVFHFLRQTSTPKRRPGLDLWTDGQPIFQGDTQNISRLEKVANRSFDRELGFRMLSGRKDLASNGSP